MVQIENFTEYLEELIYEMNKSNYQFKVFFK